MGKSAPKAPDPPNPQLVAAAQTQSNVETARVNAMMNRVNQVTPFGNLTYTQDPNNQDLWTATTQLSPQEQANLNLTQQGQQIYGQTALSELGQAQGALSTPINTNYNNVRDQYIKSQMDLINPQLEQQKNTLQAQLANQGVAQGSDAWNNAMRSFTQSQNQAYNQILGSAQNQVGSAIQQQIALRDQPLNEAQALLSGSQVAQPQFTQVPQSNVQPTDVISAYGMAQQAKQANYQAQMGQYQGKLGGMGSLAGTLGGAAMMSFSDKRIKTDIKQVATLPHPGGDLPLSTFRYKGDPVKRLGFIAQDVEKVDPGAVSEHPKSGIKGVNYARVLAGMGGNSNGV